VLLFANLLQQFRQLFCRNRCFAFVGVFTNKSSHLTTVSLVKTPTTAKRRRTWDKTGVKFLPLLVFSSTNHLTHRVIGENINDDESATNQYVLLSFIFVL
jgi:hypothetical protein